ncbi:MAG: hypothetical protein ACREDZ_16150, partial [Kiloniellales bacterium]
MGLAEGGPAVPHDLLAIVDRANGSSLPDAVISCEDNLQFMRPLASGSMKLIVTSPPYNIGKSYESRAPLASYVSEQEKIITE